MISAVIVILALWPSMATQAPGSPPTQNPHQTVAAVYVPERVYDTRRKAFSDFEVMLADLARADVVFVGEQHDDPNTHRLESAVLQGLLRRGVQVSVSLEMFERDVQATLDAYLAGRVSEEEFLKTSRPWPRYATDYRPIVEMSKAHGWRVVAANVPRRYATEVAKTGLTALDALPPAERPLAAAEVQCPLDGYFTRFVESMNGHTTSSHEKLSAEDKNATMERYYLSQCLKDETMAESIVAAFERHEGRPGTIVHFNGAFHSDFGAGAAERVRRRLPGRRVAVVSIVPVSDLDDVVPADTDHSRAEYLIYTVK